MGSLSGVLQRPLTTAAAVAVAAVSSDLSDKLPLPKPSDSYIVTEPLNASPSNPIEQSKLWVSQISVSKFSGLSFVTRIRIPIPNNINPVLNSGLYFSQNSLSKAFSSSTASPLLSLYQSAELGKASKPTEFSHSIPSSLPSEIQYRWHLPEPNAYGIPGNSDCSSTKSRTVVVLLGWLGAKQKHLKRYADWYTSRGYHAITLTLPITEILSYQISGNAEHHIDLLVNHLAGWLEEEDGKNLVFHTFSNTGWLTYGVVLQKFKQQDQSLNGRIKGCIVDSAPVAAPDPQVWASGFSAAFLKKQSIATKGLGSSNVSDMEHLVSTKTVGEPKPAVTEAALLVVLEKVFEVVLNLPTVNRRLSEVLGLLTSEQPGCPQLYIYSSADRVIPAEFVESFIEEQRKLGREVRSCNFISTPHVDHFRNEPNLYSTQLTKFLEDCVFTSCKHSYFSC